MMSSRSKKLPERPAGEKTSEATAFSYVSPVTFSTIRPARLNPAWLYEARVPGGAISVSPASADTYRVSASSPSPKSPMTPQSRPEVWLSRLSTVI